MLSFPTLLIEKPTSWILL